MPTAVTPLWFHSSVVTTPPSIGEVRFALFTLPLLYLVDIEFYGIFFPVTALCSSLLMGSPVTASKALQGHPSLCWPAEISVPGVFHGTVRLQSLRQ